MPRLPGPVRGRLAPSPTGLLHLGNALAFLLAWLGARSRGGRVILRLEDIDPERSKPAFAAAALRDMRWLGLDWDEGPDVGGAFGPYVQSRRGGLYAAALARLSALGRVYPCFCTRRELRGLAAAPHADDAPAPAPCPCRGLPEAERARLLARGRRPALRLDCGGARVRFLDRIAGPQDLTLDRCGGDFALRRSDGVVAYQLAVTVDDAAMGVTQVVRGADILRSTPRQILLQQLLGLPRPEYAHPPLVLDARGERLAKRHKSLSLAALRDSGVRPEALVGYLAFRAGLLDAPRPTAPAELVPAFSFDRLCRSPIVLPPDVAALLQRLG